MRTLLITGATGGLGSEILPYLTKEHDCVVLYRSEASFAPLRDSVRGVQADLADPASVRKAVQSIGTPYGLVHLAGGFAPGSFAETSDETWTNMLALNLTGAFTVMRETLAVMDRQAAGRIVVISSAAAVEKAPGSVAYTVSKSGLNVLIELVAKELRGTRITANALLPTALDTTAMREVMPREKLVPLARVGESVAFLLSDAAASITGALIPLTPAT
ncbi:MAG TPA: SDR family NAD(P)-dependent oxidoreductase [Thermoanaerobaculia bacterium]|jgi:NAD(P)-dependent dehydrogenase (short-subunit alcohol dehydrogenase family)|nr:SDR family NAD(P)-dependent oxidoreductase [Thermoanaerobaculia bacterium]